MQKVRLEAKFLACEYFPASLYAFMLNIFYYTIVQLYNYAIQL